MVIKWHESVAKSPGSDLSLPAEFKRGTEKTSSSLLRREVWGCGDDRKPSGVTALSWDSTWKSEKGLTCERRDQEQGPAQAVL